jgi:hypothetical protein
VSVLPSMRLWHNTCISSVLRYDKLHISISLNDDCMFICAPQTKPLYVYGACIKPINNKQAHLLQCMLLLPSHFHTTASTGLLATKTAPTSISANQGGAMNWNGYKQTRETNTTEKFNTKITKLTGCYYYIYIYIFRYDDDDDNDPYIHICIYAYMYPTNNPSSNTWIQCNYVAFCLYPAEPIHLIE